MIRIVENSSITALRKYCAHDPYGCRILAAFETYGLDTGFAYFWLQINESGDIAAAICALDSAFTVCAKGDYDCDELDLFLNMLSGSKSALRKKRPGENASGVLLRLTAACDETFPVLLDPEPELLCPVLEKSGKKLPRECFCTDMRARKAAKTLRSAVLQKDGVPASCCALHTAGDSAVLFAVATVPELRGLDLASHCIGALLHEQGGAEVYAFAAHELCDFYKKLGFTVIDEYVC